MVSCAEKTPHPSGPAPRRSAGWNRWLAPAIIIIAGAVVYFNSFSGAFVFDDNAHIVEDTRIRSLRPLWGIMTTRRPIVTLTLAINYALGGLNVWGYHAVNLGVHVLAALVLFGVVRRTLLCEGFAASWGRAAPGVAMTVALLWLVHPLQTQSVTYVIQRGESLMGLFYLLTLYCVVRGVDSPVRHFWHAAAVAACALGMSSKAVMVTAPLIVLLYDRVFLSPSLGRALRRRAGLYVGLAATWGILILCGVVQAVLNPSPTGPATVGFGFRGITPLEYLATQPGVILYYLRLSVWPHPLCLDYGWPVVRTAAAIAWPAVFVGTFLAGTVWAFRRRPWAGFVGAWFFLILVPTSSFIPIRDPLFEHRMYLPLAAVIVLAVAVSRETLRYGVQRLSVPSALQPYVPVVVVAAVASALGYCTHRRNEDYRTPVSMWRDVTEKRGDHYRGHYNLGRSLSGEGRIEEALEAFRRAYRLHPFAALTCYGMGLVRITEGRTEEAIELFRRALSLRPGFADAYNSLGVALASRGRRDEAVAAFREAVRIKPILAPAHYNLGLALEEQGKIDEAIEAYHQTLRVDPNHAGARRALEAAATRNTSANKP